VLRKVDPHGSVSFAGTCYRVGNRYRGQTVGVRLVADTVQITQDGGAAADPPCPTRQKQGVWGALEAEWEAEKDSECRIATEAISRHGW
jgi:hypothetical protein